MRPTWVERETHLSYCRGLSNPGVSMLSSSAAFQETDPALVEFADRLIRGKAKEDSPAWWKTDTDAFKRAHRAIANRFCFAVSLDDSEMGLVMVSFAPDLFLERNGGAYVPDYELQIDDIVPNPEVSETPNGTGDWFIGGFEPTQEGIKACVQNLLERGFRWDARLQKTIDQHLGTKNWVTQWMLEGSPGGMEEAAKVAEQARQVTLESFVQMSTLDELEQQLPQHENLVLMMPSANVNLDAAFWPSLRNLSRALASDIRWVPAGSELAVAFEQLDGVAGPTEWNMALFIKGKRLTGDLGSFLSQNYRALIRQHSTPSGDKPSRRRLTF